MKLLINICAQDGVVSHNSGVGTMVKRYIDSFIRFFKKNCIEYKINLISPEYHENGFGYSAITKEENENLANVSIYQFPNGSNGKKFFGNINNWEIICSHVSKFINNIDYNEYDAMITILNDTTFAKVMMETNDSDKHIKVWIPHSTAKIHNAELVSVLDKDTMNRIDWESNVIKYINKTDNCYLGSVGKFIGEHLISEYNLSESKLVKFYNGEILYKESFYEEFEKSRQLFEGLNKKGDILLSFGRPEKYKNLDGAIKLADELGLHGVIITQEYYSNMPYVNYLKDLAQEHDIELYVNAPFHFPQYIIKHFTGKIVMLVPSKKEIAGLLVNEIRRFNKSNILLVANDVDGINEQIEDGVDGILVNLENIQESALKVKKMFNDNSILNLNKGAQERLKKDYDFYKNCLDFFKAILKNKNFI